MFSARSLPARRLRSRKQRLFLECMEERMAPAVVADMAVTGSGPSTLVAGGTATYSVTLTNNGPSAATGVVLTDADPFVAGVVVPGSGSLTAAPGNPDSFTETVNPNSFNETAAGSIAAGNTDVFVFTIQFEATSPAGSTFTNSGSVTSTSTDPNSGNDSASVTTTIVPLADLAVTESGPTTLPGGDTATYSVTLTNNGPEAATGVALTDADPFVPGVVVPGSGSLTAAPGNPDTFSLTVNANSFTETATGPIASGNSDIFSLTIQFEASSPRGSTFTNSASVTSTSSDPTPGNNSAAVTTTIVPSADLAVTESGPATITAGTTATYTISVTNDGPSDAQRVNLSDVLPTGLIRTSESQVSGSDAFTDSSSGNSVVFTSGTVSAGNTDVFEVTVVAPSDLPDSTIETDTATVSSATADPNPGNNSAAVNSTVTTSADLAVTVSGPGKVTAGTSFTYTISLTNNGPSDAQGVVLTDTLSAGLTRLSESQISGPDSFTDASSGNGVSFTGTVASGDVDVFEVVSAVASNLSLSSPVTESAAVSASTTDPDSSNNSAAYGSSVATSADLAVTISGPLVVIAGTNPTYTISISNIGPSDAANVLLTEVVPSGMTRLSETQLSGSDSFTDTSTGSTLSFSATTMASGDTDVFELVAQVPSSVSDGTFYWDNASVKAATSDPKTSNNTALISSVATTVADLSVTATGPTVAAAGTTFTYTLSVADNGPSDAQNVSVTDSLPTGLTLISERQLSGADSFTDTSAGNSPSFTAGTMVSGNTDVFEVVAVSQSGITMGTVLTDSATLTSSTYDPVPGNDAASVSTTVSASADLAVSVSGSTTATAGTSVTYTISLTNDGPSNARNVSLSDVLPTGLTLISQKQVGGPDLFLEASSGGKVAFSLSALDAGNTDVFQIVVRVDSNVADGTVVSDAATVSTSTSSSTTTSPTVHTAVSTSADLSISVSGPSNVVAGAHLTYAITLTDNGPSDAQGVSMTDSLPSGLTLLSAQRVSGSGSFSIGTSGATITFTASTVAAGASDVFVISASAAVTLIDDATLRNSANVSSATDDPNANNNHATATTPVIAPQHTLAATTTGSSTAVFVIGTNGDLYQYTSTGGWTIIGAAGTVEAISAVTQTNGTVVLFAEGTDGSLSRYVLGVGWVAPIGARGTISQISAGLDHTGQADVFIIATNGGLDEWSTAAGWQAVAASPAGAALQISAVDQDNVYVLTSNGSIYGHGPAFGWFPLSSAGFARSLSATDDGTGNATVYAVTVNGAVYEYVNTTGWTEIGAAGTITVVSAGRTGSNQADLFAVTSGNELAEFDAGWKALNPPAPASRLSATAADQLFAIFADGAIEGYDSTFGFFPLTSPGFADA